MRPMTRTRKRPIQTKSDFKLPYISDEVLLIIFNLLRKDDINNSTSSSLSIRIWPFAITHTCHRWRVISLENSILWTELEYFTSQPFIEAFLERSSTLKLSLHLNMPSDEFSDYNPKYEPDNDYTPLNKYFGFTLMKCRDRIEQLFVSDALGSTETWSPVVEFLKHNPPTLQDLSLGTPTRMFPSLRRTTQSEAVILPSFTRAFSALKYISLSNVCVEWERVDLNNLSSLCLKALPSDYQSSIQQILVILKHCPLLQELELHDVQADNSQPSESDVIILSELHQLQLLGLQYGVCKKLLKQLVFSQTINWCISCTDYPAHLRLLPEVPGDILMQFTEPCDEIELALGEEILLIEGYSFKSGSRIQTSALILTNFEDVTELEDVLHILSLIIDSSVWNVAKNVVVRLDLLDEDSHDQFVVEAWTKLFKAIASTSCLTIRSPENGELDCATNFDLARALKIPFKLEDETSNTTKHFPLPLLKELNLEYANFSEEGDFYEQFLEAMQTRCDFDANLRLEKLNIESCFQVTEEQVESLSEFIDDIKWNKDLF